MADENLEGLERRLERSPKVHMELGVLHYIHGRNNEAIRELKEALKLKPDYVAAFYNLASILRELGRIDELRTLQREVAEAVKKQQTQAHKPAESLDPKMHLELGIVYYIHGCYNEAEREFKRALELNPDYSIAYYDLAVLLEEIGEKKNKKNGNNKDSEKPLDKG